MVGQITQMTGPALDACRFLYACLLGLGLGLWYGFLRPLRPRHTVLSDVLFLPALGWAWLYLSFAVCRGDIRLGYCAGLAVGAFFWEGTFGRWLRPVFYCFWGTISRIWGKIFAILKKIFKKMRKNEKNLFASGKKWFTITEYHRRTLRKRNGGAPIGK